MKLFELHHGGMSGHIAAALANLEKYKNHKDDELANACKTGIECLSKFNAMPGSTMQDPGTFAKIISKYHGKLSHHDVVSANDALSSYTPGDND